MGSRPAVRLRSLRERKDLQAAQHHSRLVAADKAPIGSLRWQAASQAPITSAVLSQECSAANSCSRALLGCTRAPRSFSSSPSSEWTPLEAPKLTGEVRQALTYKGVQASIGQAASRRPIRVAQAKCVLQCRSRCLPSARQRSMRRRSCCLNPQSPRRLWGLAKADS